MIKELIMYTAICDCCGKDVNEGTDFSCWNDESYIEDIASESEWIKDEDKHYCPDCYYYDYNDELVLKEKAQ